MQIGEYISDFSAHFYFKFSFTDLHLADLAHLHHFEGFLCHIFFLVHFSNIPPTPLLSVSLVTNYNRINLKIIIESSRRSRQNLVGFIWKPSLCYQLSQPLVIKSVVGPGFLLWMNCKEGGTPLEKLVIELEQELYVPFVALFWTWVLSESGNQVDSPYSLHSCHSCACLIRLLFNIESNNGKTNSSVDFRFYFDWWKYLCFNRTLKEDTWMDNLPKCV